MMKYRQEAQKLMGESLIVARVVVLFNLKSGSFVTLHNKCNGMYTATSRVENSLGSSYVN